MGETEKVLFLKAKAQHQVKCGAEPFFPRTGSVNCQRFHQGFADAHFRVERHGGVLKNHLHAAARAAKFFSL